MSKATKAELIQEIEHLKSKLKEKNTLIEKYRSEEEELARLKEECRLVMSEKYWTPTKNERNAGRKTKVTEEICEEIIQFRVNGKTYREISDIMGLSVGFIHKIYNSRINKRTK